jgi:hypothetical protein
VGIFEPPPAPIVVPGNGDTYVVITVAPGIRSETARKVHDQWAAVFDDEGVKVRLITYPDYDGIPCVVTFE